MIAPDAEPESDKSATPPEALASGQRALAAIVFTDTVGFSKLMSKDEEGTLRLVARDLDLMKAACGAFGGQVLKSTGDGLLMLFTSAVQAVACALEIQRDMQKRSLDLPKAEQLRHRIGIHLGDVFQHGGDVMGDGVNIAARLQTQAVPGGICLSQTVYDVVHNRLPFYVNDLGAKKLKNIGTVKAYQISPMESVGSGFRIGWYRWRSWAWSGVGVLALLFVLGTVFWLGMRRNQPGAYLLFPSVPFSHAQAAAQQPPVVVPETPLPVTVAVPPPGELIAVSQQDFELVRFDYMRKYDYEEMRDWIATHDWPGKSTSPLDENCRKMQHLLRWLQESLHAYSSARPLVITGPRGKQTAFWTVSFGGLKMRTDSQTLTVMREQIPPTMMVEIIDQLLKENPVPGDAGAKIQDELEAFAEYYQVKHPKTEGQP